MAITRLIFLSCRSLTPPTWRRTFTSAHPTCTRSTHRGATSPTYFPGVCAAVTQGYVSPYTCPHSTSCSILNFLSGAKLSDAVIYKKATGGWFVAGTPRTFVLASIHLHPLHPLHPLLIVKVYFHITSLGMHATLFTVHEERVNMSSHRKHVRKGMVSMHADVVSLKYNEYTLQLRKLPPKVPGSFLESSHQTSSKPLANYRRTLRFLIILALCQALRVRDYSRLRFGELCP